MKYKIAFIAQPEYFRFCYEKDLISLGTIFELPYHFGMRHDDFASLIDFQADFNFFFRGEFIPKTVLEQLHGINVNLSSEPFPRYINGKLVYTKDSILRYVAFRQIRNLPFHYIFHYDAASLSFIESDGLELSGSFPFPVATNTYQPSLHQKEWDFFFIGRSTRHRELFFNPLKHHFHFLHICHGIWGPPLINYINRSQICLNIHAENEMSWEPRVQMLLSCGAFVISEKITTNNILRPGIDYVEVGNPTELYQAAEYYLHNQDERQKIANTGANRVKEKLSSCNNFSELVSDIANDKYSVFKHSKGTAFLNGIDWGYKIWTRIKKTLF